MKNKTLSLLLFQGVLCIGLAAAQEPQWLACRLEASERQLDCYQHATERYLANQKIAEATPDAGAAPVQSDKIDWKLDQLWPLPAELPTSHRLANTFLQHKQNYLILDSVHRPDDAPTSPNPFNRVPPDKMPQTSEIKYQISLKAPLPVTWPWGDTLWFAYTQNSYWQAFNGGNSRFFRETNYEPELIFLSHRFGADAPRLGAFTPRVLNLAYVHQSNGQSLPRSRSWNRLAAQLGGEYRFKSEDEDSEEKYIAILLRPWWRIRENARDDDNADITKYLGHGDIEIDYWRGSTLVSLLVRSRAVQFDWSFPLTDETNALKLHLQYFNGYGKSLIDYNHKLHSFGAGVSLPY